jgi:quercetin dioxygenase-like cupin family protein
VDVEVVHPVTLVAARRGALDEDHRPRSREAQPGQDGEDRAGHDATRAARSVLPGPGQAQKPHRHADQDKICFVLEGAGTFSLDRREEVLGPGDAVVFPSGSEHGILNTGSSELLVLVVVTPPPPHAT